jgi:type IV pilus assembly protein PilB
LLPIERITVDIAGYEPPRTVVELIPASVARENLLVPLELKSRGVLIADAGPLTGDLLDKLEFILNRRVILVMAELEDVRAALARVYGETETESVKSPPLFIDHSVSGMLL